jgi:hypothetical protein
MGFLYFLSHRQVDFLHLISNASDFFIWELPSPIGLHPVYNQQQRKCLTRTLLPSLARKEPIYD